jgi:hypothetical protein
LAAGALLAACDGASVMRAAPRPLVRSPASAAGLRPTTMSSLFGSESIELKPGAKTMIVGVQIKQQKYKTLLDKWSLTDSLDELVRLCETAGLVVTARESQVMQHPSPSTFIGTGKLDEIVASAIAGGVTVVVFDDELSPAQARNLQSAFMVGTTTEAIVLDRTQLILQIFAQRARTRVAKLQVQAAQMKYMMPRLTSFLTAGAGMDAKGGSGSGGGSGGSGGGSALRGTGETQLESDKRLFRKQARARGRCDRHVRRSASGLLVRGVLWRGERHAVAAKSPRDSHVHESRANPSPRCAFAVLFPPPPLLRPCHAPADSKDRAGHGGGAAAARALPRQARRARQPARHRDRRLHERGQVDAAQHALRRRGGLRR